MTERIRALAEVLQIRDGQLVRLARDIAKDATLLDLEHMRESDLEELERFLVAALTAERKMVGVTG